MDWKKETISASELEKRQKEYMNAAMSMMKRSSVRAETVPVAPSEPVKEAEPPAPVIAEAVEQVQETVQEAVSSAEPESDEIKQSEAVTVGDIEPVPDEEPPAGHSDKLVEEEAPENAVTTGNAEESDDDSAETKYGVYTADEIKSGEYRDDGLRKAAEILEEMTRNTEMMKRLAEGEEDSGTTDFPDFSCGTDGEDEDSFRKAKEECGETLQISEDCGPEDE